MAAAAREHRQDSISVVSVKLTTREVDLLTALASDQLFRREFIDPKLPGHRSNPGELSMGKELISRLREMADRARKMPRPMPRTRKAAV